MLEQRPRQRGRKIWSLHAPEIECIGKGKAACPLRVRLQGLGRHHTRTLEWRSIRPARKALPGNPYDGHTLATIIPDMEKTIGNEVGRILVDAGYRGHNAPDSHKFRVFTAGKKRRITQAIERQMRRRSAIEPVIGHIKAEHRMSRDYLAGEQGDAINAIQAAAGYNFLAAAQLVEAAFVADPRRAPKLAKIARGLTRFIVHGRRNTKQSDAVLWRSVRPPNSASKTTAMPPRHHCQAKCGFAPPGRTGDLTPSHCFAVSLISSVIPAFLQ